MNGYPIQLEQYQETIIETAGVQGRSATFPLPVLIHCKRGADRTGVMVAAYRMAFQGWALDEAKLDMIRHFHLPFSHPAQFEFLESAAQELDPDYGSRNAPKDLGQEAEP